MTILDFGKYIIKCPSLFIWNYYIPYKDYLDIIKNKKEEKWFELLISSCFASIAYLYKENLITSKETLLLCAKVEEFIIDLEETIDNENSIVSFYKEIINITDSLVYFEPENTKIKFKKMSRNLRKKYKNRKQYKELSKCSEDEITEYFRLGVEDHVKKLVTKYSSTKDIRYKNSKYYNLIKEQITNEKTVNLIECMVDLPNECFEYFNHLLKGHINNINLFEEQNMPEVIIRNEKRIIDRYTFFQDSLNNYLKENIDGKQFMNEICTYINLEEGKLEDE